MNNNNIFEGLEILIIGFLIVMMALFLLALILVCFNRIFTVLQEKKRLNYITTVTTKEIKKKQNGVTYNLKNSRESNYTFPVNKVALKKMDAVVASIGAFLYYLETQEDEI